MRPILEQLAIHLAGDPGPGLGDYRVILPNRRAVLFLRHHLARHIRKVSWSPVIQSINDFVAEASLIKLADPLQMQFILYEIYEQCVEHPEPFDEFYYWGEIMLRDFDEIDKYLVDPEMLYRNLADLKELEEPLAGMDEIQLSFIRQFWSGFSAGDTTPEKEKFLSRWEILPIVYRRFREKLMEGGTGYQGMLYRDIAGRIAEGTFDIPGGGQTVIAGFNALNGGEKKLFHWFRSRGARFYWDYDLRYTGRRNLEAGRFLGENLVQYPEYARLEAFDNLSGKKEIRIFELPSDVLQAKLIRKLLPENDPPASQDCTDTALVLCDEELLMPVILSLPDASGEVNITMGYPMKNTPVYALIDLLLQLQENLRREKEGPVRFYHRDVTAILVHPFFAGEELGSGAASLPELISSENMMYVEEEFFTGPLFRKVFRRVENARELLAYFREIFTTVLTAMADPGEVEQQRLNREFIFQLLVQLNKLENLLESHAGMTTSTLVRLLRKILAILRVPFEGEPLSGLQIMGILETRLLDFRHVIVLSLNEEIMPGSGSARSFIPYALRMAFGMPAKEDMDAIYAYYFYRLLQRAEKIDLLFNSGSEGLRTGEMSRYLHQLKFDRDITVLRPGLDVAAREIMPVSVEKTPGIAQKLQRYLVQGTENEGRYLSPSALNTYIDCPLRFYLRYLAGIGEADQVEEDLDAAGFGTVVHETIHTLYSGITGDGGDNIGRTELAGLLEGNHPARVLERKFLDHHFHGRRNASLSGRNIIIYRVMLKYLRRIMETDLKLVPFSIVNAEATFTRDLEISAGGEKLTVRLGGKIDRVDRVGGVLRVIDYKTGHAAQSFPSIASLFDPGSTTRNRAALQVLFYTWLAEPVYGTPQIVPGLYVMRELYEAHFDPCLYMGGMSKGKRIDNFGEYSESFVQGLKQIIESLFDPDAGFTQTPVEAQCRNCDFTRICNRSSVD